MADSGIELLTSQRKNAPFMLLKEIKVKKNLFSLLNERERGGVKWVSVRILPLLIKFMASKRIWRELPVVRFRTWERCTAYLYEVTWQYIIPHYTHHHQ